MSKLTEQLREALTPDEQGNIHLSHEILASIPALLAEHEKLEREAEAWKNFMQDIDLLYAKKDCECQGAWVKCMHAILGEKVEAYRAACEK